MAATTSNREIHIYHASAGTGKTHALMDIIAGHVKAGIPLSRIAFVTFTRAGAEVAKQRVCEQFGINLKDAPHFRTIHSMCFHALGMKADLMMDKEKYQDFGVKAGYDFQIDVGQRKLVDGIDWARMDATTMVSFEQLYRNNRKMGQQLYDQKVDGIDFPRYCREYVKYKKTFGYKDFTDLLQDYIDNDCCEDVDVACIDEAQDCSPLQWRVLITAFRSAKYIYVAGDDKQEIYRYSGTDGSILTHMRGTQHYLNTTYRVPKNILSFVNDKIVSQMEDIVHMEDQSIKEGGSVNYISKLDELSKFDYNKSYFMLARNKKFLRTYKDWCEEHLIPYRLLGTPIFSDKEKQQFRDHQTDSWNKKKLQAAQEYYRAGTFYMTPNVDIETIHGVKGDEADVVILMPDISRLTWKAYVDDPNDEHRVFYVGCTRAREQLIIMEPQTSKSYPYIL